MLRIQLSPEQRDRIATLLLLGLGLIAFPVLGSILSKQNTPSPVVVASVTPVPVTAVAAGGTAVAATETETATPAPSDTPTVPQGSPSGMTPTVTDTPRPPATPTLPSRVYLLPFRQIFVANPASAFNATAPFLYEYGSDVFRVIDRQGVYARLQTMDASQSYWTDAQNISLDPPSAPQYDFSVRGRTVQLAGAAGWACPHQLNVTPPIDPCDTLFSVTSTTLTARITSGPVALYLADVNGKPYFLLPTAGTLGP